MAKNNFRGMPGGMNQAAMMKQAQKMQQEMLRMQEEMENKTYTATSGGGMVCAAVNGKHELLGLEIKPDAVDPDDVEMLQDMSLPLLMRQCALPMPTLPTICPGSPAASTWVVCSDRIP